jgi:DNA-binding MarR family transcriptional regulator
MRAGLFGNAGGFASASLTTGSNMTVVSAKLEKRGLVVSRTDDEDTRNRLVHLTRQGGHW